MKISTVARAASLLLALLTSAVVIGGTLIGMTNSADEAATVLALERAARVASKAG